MRPRYRLGIAAVTALLVATSGCTRSKDDRKRAREKTRIGALPYLSSKEIAPEDEGKQGVTTFDRERAYRGYTLFNSGKKAHLMDMEGNRIHTWKRPLEQEIKEYGKVQPWQHTVLRPNGDLFVVVDNHKIMKLDRDSNLIWTARDHYHHEIEFADNGDIYTLLKGRADIPFRKNTAPILNDWIAILDADGNLKRKISMFDLFGDSVSKRRRAQAFKRHELDIEEFGEVKLKHDSAYDVFHSNAIDLIRRDVDGLFKKGNIIVSIRNIHTIGVIDLESEKVVWSYGGLGKLHRQHDARLVGDEITVYDNGVPENARKGRKYTMVLRIDPRTNEVVWNYGDRADQRFYAHFGGSSRVLPNGNVLITDTPRGRLFEVTPEGDLVWDYWNPDTMTKKGRQERRTIYRALRYDRDYVDAALPGLLKPPAEQTAPPAAQ